MKGMESQHWPVTERMAGGFCVSSLAIRKAVAAAQRRHRLGWLERLWRWMFG